MTVIYHMRDFYDWEEDSELKGGFVTDGEMDELHRYGLAKEYELLGECKIDVTWEEGERYTVGDSSDIKITNVR